MHLHAFVQLVFNAYAAKFQHHFRALFVSFVPSSAFTARGRHVVLFRTEIDAASVMRFQFQF